MLKLDHPIMEALESVDSTILWRAHPNAKKMAKMWKNNLKQRQKTKPDVSENLVLVDTAVGYGAEIATTESGVINSVNDIVDNPDDIPYADRMRDYVWKDIFMQGKTSKLTQPYYYISSDQMKSLERSVPFNSYLIVTGYSELGKFHYRYITRYIIDFKKFMEKPSKYLLRKAAYSYPFDAEKAIENGICHRF